MNAAQPLALDMVVVTDTERQFDRVDRLEVEKLAAVMGGVDSAR
jgi:hypothetical protein